MYKSITLRAFDAEWPTQRRLLLARQAKYDGVEVNLEPGGEYTLESDEYDLVNLRRQVELLGLRVSSVYSRQQWFNPITSQEEETRRRGQRIIERLAWAASVLGTDAVLVVPGAVDNSLFVPKPEITPYDVAYRNALAVLREAVRAGEQHQVTLAVENVWGKFLLSPMEFAHFIDEVGSERIGAYFDVGNVLRLGFPEHWIPILSSRIKRVHFKDFRLSVDTLGGFVGLLEGDVNWPAVRRALRQIGYDSWVTAEVLPPYRHLSERLIYETSANLDAILDQL
jgi:hexulose-6-phosphate isomerase